MLRTSLNPSVRDGGSSPGELASSLQFLPRSSGIASSMNEQLMKSHISYQSHNNSILASSIDQNSHNDVNISIDMNQHDPETLFQLARSNTIIIRSVINESKLFPSIEGSNDLIQKLDEFLVELDHQRESILDVMSK